ncbi:hypothetical protein KLA_16247 [Cellulophaga geojensis KL-A]|uniref:Tetratricopeptide repeat protein n=1 Tax=Cellulophaga geojensis KL-A TaxID=1328323 RepID=A0ABP3B2R6_9FLAO|nr:hypothetical protein KLA_16247 [Cellulophaga geojensis KL-A]
MIASFGYAQEIENSADVFLEEYSDDFQEAFFEGLKQKGIENYDRAVNSFLVCQKIEPKNAAVANELAKAYLKSKQYSLAQEQAEIALNEDPNNMWYLESLYISLKKQYKNVSNLKEIVPYSNYQLKENLAHLLYLKQNYNEAKNVLVELNDGAFKEDFSAKLQAAIDHRKANTNSFTFTSTTVTNTPTKKTTARQTTSNSSNSAFNYKSRLKFTLKQKNYVFLETTAKEALEAYPSQPYFYYALGTAYNGRKKHRAAIETLKMGLDYVLDDIRLADNFYREIAAAYTAMGNPAKANMYLAKVKFKK